MSIISGISKNKKLELLERLSREQTSMIILLDMYVHSLEQALIEANVITKEALDKCRAQTLSANAQKAAKVIV